MKKKTNEIILEATARCLTIYGIHNTSFQKIADEAKVSQPLVAYHLKNMENVFPSALMFVVQKAVVQTEARLTKDKDPKTRLSDYLKVSYEIFNNSKEFAAIYLQMYFLSHFDEKIKALNTQIKRKAIQRVAEIITEGQNLGIFKKELNPFSTAKLIHNHLVGFLISSITEVQDFSPEQLLVEMDLFTKRSICTVQLP